VPPNRIASSPSTGWCDCHRSIDQHRQPADFLGRLWSIAERREPARYPRTGLLPKKTRRRQKPPGSVSLPQTTPLRRRLPTTHPRRSQTWGRPRENTRGRLQYPARRAQTPHTDASDKSLPGPTSSHHTTVLDAEDLTHREAPSKSPSPALSDPGQDRKADTFRQSRSTPTAS
jgi:hypothetical protein